MSASTLTRVRATPVTAAGGHNLIAAAIPVFAIGLAVYRAANVPITHDEALTYWWFLDRGEIGLLSFNANNHVLFSLLCKPFILLFGVRELSLRAPALLAAAGYLTAVYVLCRRLFVGTSLFPISVALLTLNPTLSDFLFLARGYGMGLTFLMWAAVVMSALADKGKFDVHDVSWRRGCFALSVLLALAVAANLTELFPAVALWTCFAALVMYDRARAPFEELRREVRTFAAYALAPGALLGLCILWPYAIQMRPGQFYAGYRSFSKCLSDLFTSFFLYRWTESLASLGALPPRLDAWQRPVTAVGALVFLPLLALSLLAATILILRSTRERLVRETPHSLLFAGGALLSAALWLALHFAIGLRLPLSRTCLFAVPLFALGSILASQHLAAIRKWRRFRVAGVLALTVILADFVACTHVRYCRYAAYDGVSRQVFLAVATNLRQSGAARARMGGTWWYEPEMDFYRARYHVSALATYDVKDPSYLYQTQNSLTPVDYDYFFYTPANDPHLPASRFRVIFRDRTTGLTVVAIHKPTTPPGEVQ